ncbi:23 kDa integral membrane protein-like [Entelurus aequoreus]|uniref:23 kDa integral membrane protein-like n=1 Tax=Entelurus aequoreus TaxID=161455 RepID=UPI002B1D2F54|nr:23 kDa integral membrane protein-like [Entelurus aequoreus]XP_061922353.1 23 kDa integral membrane protein-like [Entelurus aequoreus]
MGKINGCLKCLFIFFNVIFAIIGCLLIFGVVKASIYSQQLSAVGAPGMAWVWVFAIGVIAISCLGIYAGSSERGLALKMFAGFMGVGMIIMLIFGIIVVVLRNKVRDNFRSASSDAVKQQMDQEEFRKMLEQIQQSAQCCGLVSPKDWGDDIPASCECKSSGSRSYGIFGSSGCSARPQGSRGPNQIYAETCSDFIITWTDFFFNIVMGFFFGFAVTALLGLLVSLLMVHQVKRHDQGGPTSMAMKGY